MTYGRDYGQQGQYPQQGYGQQYPQDQPWEPQPYDPGPHQQHIGTGQYPPQGQLWPPQAPQWQQPGYGQPPFPQQQPGYQPGPPPHRKSWPARHKVLTGLIAFGALIVIGSIASAAGNPSSGTATGTSASQAATQPAAPASPLAPASSAPATRAAAAQTVTFKVTGSPADVTYGAAGSDLSGSVPMKVTQKLGSPIYYSLQAQLQGGGSVTVEILIDGKVISKGTATGGYNIAMAEVSQDPLSGQWTDTQG